MKLPRTVPLGANETPASFASRMGALYELSAREFTLDWGVRFQAVVDGDPESIAKIALVGGVSPEKLVGEAFVRTSRHSFVHRGQQLVRQVLRRGHIYVCPACLREDIEAAPDVAPDVAPDLAPYGRASWLIEAVKTCHRHRIALVEMGHDMTPYVLHDFAFHVARALPTLGTLERKAERRQPTEFEGYVLRRFEGTVDAPFLDRLPLYAAIRSCETIGAVAVFGRKVDRTRMTDKDWRRAGQAGFGIAKGGPLAIQDFLRELHGSFVFSRSSNDGPQAIFGKLHPWLATETKDPAYDALRDVFGEYIGANLPLGEGELVYGKPVMKRTLHSVWTLSLESGLHPKRLRKILRAAGVISENDMMATYNAAVFPADAGTRIATQSKLSLTLRESGSYLNAPRVHSYLLANHGFIVPSISGRDFEVENRYAIADLDDFLKRLLEGAVPVTKPKAGQVNIPTAARSSCRSAVDVLRLILDRKLSWVGNLSKEKGYMAVLVDVAEVRAKTRGRETGGLTQRPAARKLQTTDKVVGKLIRYKRLKTYIERNPVNRCKHTLVSHAEIERFYRTYVSLATLARERNESIGAVSKLLTTRRIEPLWKLKEIGARYYRRSTLNRRLRQA